MVFDPPNFSCFFSFFTIAFFMRFLPSHSIRSRNANLFSTLKENFWIKVKLNKRTADLFCAIFHSAAILDENKIKRKVHFEMHTILLM